MPKRKFKVLKVTFQNFYLVEMFDEHITEINGWSIEEVIEDWFKRHPLSSYHATRDGHAIGNTKKFINYEVIEESDLKNEF